SLPPIEMDSPHSSDKLLIVEGCLGTIPVRVLIESGAKGDFVNEETRQKAGLKQPLPSPKELTVADGRVLQCHLTPQCPLTITGFSMTLHLLAAPLFYDVILGKPWLATHNPTIDWKNNTLSFSTPEGQLITWTASDAQSRTEPSLTAKQFHRL